MSNQDDEKAKQLGPYNRVVPGLPASLRLISQIASVLAILVGCLVLVGWAFNIEALKRVFPGLTATTSTAAIAFILAGASLQLLTAEPANGGRLRMVQGCAFIVALVGLLRLAEPLLGFSLDIHQLLFSEESGVVEYQLPNRMAPNTALNLLLIGSALLLLDSRTQRGRRPAQFLALVAAFASSLPLIGYIYGIESFYGPVSYFQMPLLTVLTLILLEVGLLCARPDSGVMTIITSDSTGGVMVRRLLPAAILIPAVLGWLRLEGEWAGLYDTELGAALLVLVNMLVFATLVAWNARLLYRTDVERKRAEEEVRELNETLEERVTERTEQLAEREDQLKELVRKLLVAQEEERRRIAYELHDGPTQVAIAAHQHLQAFADDHPPGSRVAPGELNRALELAQRAVKEARRIIEGLRPKALDDFGLAHAIRLQVEELRAQGWEIGYEETLGEKRLPAEIETALYRVAQEALTNVRKHARTNRVRLTLARLPHKVRLEVSDEGCGFDPSATSGGGPGEKVGLSGMRERIALLRGQLKITSKPGVGTSLVAEVPLPTSENTDKGKP